jgi:class 3 adenylate cyclase
MASTQTVTILFTDIVGSTELSTALDPKAADELRQTHFGLLRAALTAAGGIGVKNLGDGLMVAFSSLSRALACAVAMQQAVERHKGRSEHPIAIRVGLSTGEATEEDGDYFGEPVIEATRLCAHAERGAGPHDEHRSVVGRTPRHATPRHATPPRSLRPWVRWLKGLPDPVEVVGVRWAPDVDAGGEGTQLPLPARLVATSAESLFAFFGRTDELKTLEDLHKRSATEHRLGVVLISGEPGVGKTSLVAQAARSVHHGGATVLYGGCDEDLAVPYKPWMQAHTPLVQSVGDEVLRRFTDTNGLTLARLVPHLARRLGEQPPSPAAESDAERFMIMESVVRFLTAASAETPLLVVLDDLHWADAASSQLLGQLAHSSEPMALTVVGTFRDSDLSRSHPLTPLLARLHRESTVERLPLVGLEDFEIIGLMEAAAGHALPDDGVFLAHALRRETRGNPFFVVEMLLHLAQEGIFVQGDDGRWRLTVDIQEIGLPTSVREVVAQRVATLGEETERALSMASVIGRDFDLQVLATLLGGDELELMDRMERAIAAGILAEAGGAAGGYRFVHALIQHTLYQDLSAARRQRAHQRVAEVLEDTGSDDPERLAALARHWLAATRQADVTKAVYYTRRAGQVALGAYTAADTVAWFSQALEVLDRHGAPEAERGQLLVELGIAQNAAGMPEHRQTLLDAAEIAQGLGDADLLMGAALVGRRGDVVMTEADPERAAILQAAL